MLHLYVDRAHLDAFECNRGDALDHPNSKWHQLAVPSTTVPSTTVPSAHAMPSRATQPRGKMELATVQP
jgi:hypothetical protein